MNAFPWIFPVVCICLVGLCFRADAAEAQPLRRVATEEKVIALTFDDGPDEQTLQLMDLFAAEGGRVTFFVIGEKLEDHPEIVRRAFEAGHELGNHSYTHKKLPEMTSEEIDEEIARTQSIVKKATGAAPVLFRAPYLAYYAKVWDAIQRHGLRAVNANASTSDWDTETTVEQIIERATGTLTPGSIVLMHTFSKNTLAALPEILRILKAEGYRCVTVSEMLKLQR